MSAPEATAGPLPTRGSRPPALSVSVAWGYAFAFVLMAFVLLVLLPEAEGPSPWDALAFRSAILGLFANFRLLDDLAALGIVRVADVGGGFLTVDLDMLAVSDRAFGWAPVVVAIACACLSLLLRGLRQRVLAGHLGLANDVPGRTSSYFFGRGMNLFFPFGPGDLATARALDGGDGTSSIAVEVVWYNRVFELLAILGILFVGLTLLGWGGAVVAVAWTVFLVVVTVSLTQPLGWTAMEPRTWNVFARLWRTFHGPEVARAIGRLTSSPRFLIGVALLSVTALFLEIVACWYIKQAFSAPLEDYVLMKDLSFLRFVIVISVVALTRIIPYTFAGFGVSETVAIVMFRVQGEGFISGTTVALLDSLLLNTVTLAFFLASLRVARRPSILETWQLFYRRSALASSA